MPNRKKMLLGDIVWPEHQYARSTNLEIASRDPTGVPDFNFTSKSLRFLENVVDTVQGVRRDRAWAVIGPYGSGKSTFALFLLELLGGSESAWLKRCLLQLRLADPVMEQRVRQETRRGRRGYIPVVVQGSRTPLDLALCWALHKTATDHQRDTTWTSESFLSSLDATIQTAETGIHDSGSVVKLYERAAHLVRDAGYKGLFVVIDEFGKFLERARWQGDIPDLISAQYLAETASGSDEPQILLFTVLHQGFKSYGSSLSRQQWLEWVKVQGRFRQVDFSEEPRHLYGLVAASLVAKDRSSDVQEGLSKWAHEVWSQVRDLPAFEAESQTGSWSDILERVYPFHPLALYALPRLSAYLGQNERTLFTFVASDDPLGLKTFLRRSRDDGDEFPSLSLDYLYDYFVAGSRFAWLPPDVQRRVSEVGAALERLGDMSPTATRLLKAIGVISLLRPGSQLQASERVLAAALDARQPDSVREISQAIEELSSRKIIVYRRFAEEYRIWRGSDFDFDAAITKAREEMQFDLDLTSALNKEIRATTMVARHHSFESGTTRVFRTKLVAAGDLLGANNHHLSDMLRDSQCDGLIVFALPKNLQELDALRRWAREVSEPRVLVALPQEPSGLDQIVADVAALRKIRDERPEIQDDDVAAQELASRIDATEDYLDEHLSALREPGPKGPIWYWRGSEVAVPTRRSLNRLISEICDTVYPDAPTVRNELINREVLSSAVMVAAKKILDGLLASVDQERLGLVGSGPEVSIFRSLLEEHDLYRVDDRGNWNLHRPRSEQDGGLARVWEETETFLRSTATEARPIDELLAVLAAPPYGMRRGLVLFLVWIVFITNRSTVALYDDGTYVRHWATQVFDRFHKLSSGFSVRQMILSGGGATLIRSLNRAIPGAADLGDVDDAIPLNGFLQNLYDWYRFLPDYTKQTERLSMRCRGLRSALLTDSDPADLVFKSIPAALELADDGNSELQGSLSDGFVEQYAQRFKLAIRRIEGSYGKLVSKIAESMARVFGCRPTVTDVRETLGVIDQAVLDHVLDSDAKAFLLRARLSEGTDSQWIESVTAVLSGQSCRFWLDKDFDEFRDRLASASLAIRDAHRYLHARSAIGRSGPRSKRITVEDSQGVIAEEYIIGEDLDATAAVVGREILQVIEDQFPGSSAHLKRALVVGMLELMAEREGDER